MLYRYRSQAQDIFEGAGDLRHRYGIFMESSVAQLNRVLLQTSHNQKKNLSLHFQKVIVISHNEYQQHKKKPAPSKKLKSL